MSNVVSLSGDQTEKVRAPQINESAIEMIERLLAKMRTGEVTSVGYCCVLNDGSSRTAYDKQAGDSVGMIAGASILMHRVNATMVEI